MRERYVPSRDTVRGLQEIGRAEIRRLAHREEGLEQVVAELEGMCAYRTQEILNLVERFRPHLLRRSRVLTQDHPIPKREFGWSLIDMDRRLAHAVRRLDDTRERIRELEEEITIVGSGARMFEEAARTPTVWDDHTPVAHARIVDKPYEARR